MCDVFLPTVAARIWAACCWPKRMADGWSIGDYQFVVISWFGEVRAKAAARATAVDWKVPNQDLYAAVVLDALIAAPTSFDADAMLMLASELPGLSAQPFGGTQLRLDGSNSTANKRGWRCCVSPGAR